MAYMVKEGLADFAITEDSDLIAFGCPKVVLKMNWNGFGQLFDYEAFQKTNGAGRAWDNALRTLNSLDREEFINMCCMGGCEYMQSIDRVGLKVVLKHLAKVKTCKKVVEELRSSKAMSSKVPANYEKDLEKIRTIFKFQTVYDPRSKRFVPLT